MYSHAHAIQVLTSGTPVISALKTLWLLGAVDASKRLTDAGRKMAAFPVDPVYACAIVASEGYHCTFEVIDIISVLSASSKLFHDITEQREAVAEQRKKFRHPSGDHMTILNVFRAYQEITAASVDADAESSVKKDKAAKKDWCRKHFLNERTLLEALEIRSQLHGVCERLNINWTNTAMKKTGAEGGVMNEEESIIRSLGHGLCGNAAFLQPDGTYKQIMGQAVCPVLAVCLGFILTRHLLDCQDPSRVNAVR